MAYRIVYNVETTDKQFKSVYVRFFLTLFFFLSYICMVSIFWPESRDLLKLLLIPGDPDATLQAAETFAQELQSGFSFSEAAETFCEIVLRHGHTN